MYVHFHTSFQVIADRFDQQSQPSPANNQTLVGIETATTASNAIREDFWVDNGDLVLEVEQHRFKILRADLSCSEVFKDMFDLSDMPVPEEECVDGVPLVRLAHDKARDWMVLLWWLYDFECALLRLPS